MITQTIKKERSSNLELYRIIVMLMIVAHHYLVNSGLIQVIHDEPLTLKNSFFYIFGMWGKTGINCFLMITGYFMCTSRITVRKFLQLLLQIMFYNIVLNLVFVACGYQTINAKTLFHMMPIQGVADGFTSCFLLFYLCIPFLNILIQNMDKRMHRYLILLLLFIYSIIGNTVFIPMRFNYVTWFCVLYVIASYIRFYASDSIYIFTRRYKAHWGLWSIILMLLAIASVMAIVAWTRYRGLEFVMVSDSNHLLAVLIAICTFMYFKHLKIRNSKIINHIASATFGVLLIHGNSDVMRQWLWRDLLDNTGVYKYNVDGTYPMTHAVVSVLVIFTVCVVIDLLRKHLLEQPLFAYYDKRFGKKTISVGK